jgi:hypothetical protein
MSMLELCERIQETWLSQAISQSTWGYPIVGALHVLAIALFGGSVLVTHLRALGFAFRRQDLPKLDGDVRSLKMAGLVAVLVTGILLFASQPVRYYSSTSFRIKMVLLALIVVNALATRRARAARDSDAAHAGISLALWAAVVFAARGIAFF